MFSYQKQPDLRPLSSSQPTTLPLLTDSIKDDPWKANWLGCQVIYYESNTTVFLQGYTLLTAKSIDFKRQRKEERQLPKAKKDSYKRRQLASYCRYQQTQCRGWKTNYKNQVTPTERLGMTKRQTPKQGNWNDSLKTQVVNMGIESNKDGVKGYILPEKKKKHHKINSRSCKKKSHLSIKIWEPDDAHDW